MKLKLKVFFINFLNGEDFRKRFYFSNIANLITFNSLEKFLGISAETGEKFS